MRVYAVEVVYASGETHLTIFFSKSDANEVYHYLANFGHNVYKWEL